MLVFREKVDSSFFPPPPLFNGTKGKEKCAEAFITKPASPLLSSPHTGSPNTSPVSHGGNKCGTQCLLFVLVENPTPFFLQMKPHHRRCVAGERDANLAPPADAKMISFSDGRVFACKMWRHVPIAYWEAASPPLPSPPPPPGSDEKNQHEEGRKVQERRLGEPEEPNLPLSHAYYLQNVQKHWRTSRYVWFLVSSRKYS